MGVVGRLNQYASMLAGEFDDYSMSENLFLYSEQYNNSAWIKLGSSMTSNIVTAPDGFSTAEELIGINGVTGRQSVYQNISVTSGTIYTFSVFLKQGGRRYITIWFDNLNITEGAYYGAATYIDLQTGTIASGSQSKIVAYPNGWYRCYVTATPSFTGTLSLNTAIGTPNNSLDGAGTIAYQYTGDGVSGIYLWGGQFETGSAATDYTPTTTTAKTRVLSSTTNTNITGLGTYYSSGFDENVGFTTFLPANISPPYDPVYDEFGGTLFGAGQGRYMRQYTDKSVIVYNEIDEITDLFGRGIVRDGLVLDLDAGVSASYPGSGTTWTDLSVYGNNGTLTNGPTYSSANSGNIVFDGSNDYVDLGNKSILKPTNQITVSCWAYRSNWNDSDTDVIISCTEAAGYEFYYSTNIMRFYVYAGGSYRIPEVSTSSLIGWVNFTGTYDNRYAKIYLNGVLQNTVDSGATNNISYAANNILIGAEAGSSTLPADVPYHWTGNIAQVSIYNSALTSTQILQNYNALKNRFGL